MNDLLKFSDQYPNKKFMRDDFMVMYTYFPEEKCLSISYGKIKEGSSFTYTLTEIEQEKFDIIDNSNFLEGVKDAIKETFVLTSELFF